MAARTVSTSLIAVALAAGLLVGPGATGAEGDLDAAKYAKSIGVDGVLKSGCHNYPYRYRVKPPTSQWAFETFLVDRRGESVASGVALAGQDPEKGTLHFRFCRENTVPGRFKIKLKFTSRDGYAVSDGFAKPSFFTLRRP
ncbi:MAG: hypothetical protein F2667_06895 [Actinobacteria bacterium]|uniref:Unannotated protein n=1 Tax=freshwater metagenome TaxID=449393 RepID=A0A6J6QH61_9ZZZZ|nr:hypothetical protein [Actinomycetota bacterium]